MLSGLPITVAEAETVGDDYVRAESEPNKNTSKGSSSDVAAALAKAEETDEPAEVVSQREVDSQVFANPDGTMTRETAQGPIFADEGGTLTPIDPDLEPSGSRLEPKVVSQDTSFSATGDGVTAQVESEANQKISLTSLADLGTPEVDGGVATYPVTGTATSRCASPRRRRGSRPTSSWRASRRPRPSTGSVSTRLVWTCRSTSAS
ncbi:MAG: hypothetical protein PGN15_15700 [Aeromicrobium erythreum]